MKYDAKKQGRFNLRKTNEMLVFIIMLFTLVLGIQLWLLFGTINEAWDSQDLTFIWYCFGASLLLFIVLVVLLRYVPALPTGINSSKEENEV